MLGASSFCVIEKLDLYYKKYKVKPKNAVLDKKNCLKCRKLRKMKNNCYISLKNGNINIVFL